MISDSCSKFLQDDDIKSLMIDLKYYLNNKTYSKYYSGDVKTRCQWILLNIGKSTHYEIHDQVRVLLDTLDTSTKEPRMTDEELADVDTGWSF